MKNTSNLTVSAQGSNELVLARVFDAPPAVIFDAFTQPTWLNRWFGPEGYNLSVCEIDLRVGGAYRFVMRGSDGSEMGWSGRYTEIVRPDRLVHTELFDTPWYPGEAIITSYFQEQSGKTAFCGVVRYVSQEARDGVLRTPMEHGVASSYDRLAALLAQEKSRSS